MGKNQPWFQMYPLDWLGCTELLRVSLTAEGAWIRIIQTMWREYSGTLEMPLKEWKSLLRQESLDQTLAILIELDRADVGTVEYFDFASNKFQRVRNLDRQRVRNLTRTKRNLTRLTPVNALENSTSNAILRVRSRRVTKDIQKKLNANEKNRLRFKRWYARQKKEKGLTHVNALDGKSSNALDIRFHNNSARALASARARAPSKKAREKPEKPKESVKPTDWSSVDDVAHYIASLYRRVCKRSKIGRATARDIFAGAFENPQADDYIDPRRIVEYLESGRAGTGMSPYDVLRAVRAQKNAEEAEKSRPKPETERLPRYDWDYDIDALVRIFEDGQRVPWDMQGNRPLTQEEIEAGRKRVEEKRKRAPKLPRPFLTWWEEGKLDEFLERHPEWKQTLREKYGYGDG